MEQNVGQPRCEECKRKIWWGNGKWNHEANVFTIEGLIKHPIHPLWPGDVGREWSEGNVKVVDC